MNTLVGIWSEKTGTSDSGVFCEKHISEMSKKLTVLRLKHIHLERRTFSENPCECCVFNRWICSCGRLFERIEADHCTACMDNFSPSMREYVKTHFRASKEMQELLAQRKAVVDSYGVNRCCYVEPTSSFQCEERAEFEIYDCNRSDPDNIGYRSCQEHIGFLLGTTVGYPDCNKWTIYEIPQIKGE